MTETEIRDALRLVIDPELGVNVVDLGLVYGIDVDDDRVHVAMTMTSPACPLAEYLKDMVEAGIKGRIPSVQSVEITLVWEPPWDPGMMSDEGRRQLDGD